jgi:2'-5' RNA ligase
VELRLVGPRRWPDTVYAAIEPGGPLVELQRRLQAAFPDFPIYGEPSGFVFVPHVTVAEGDAARDPSRAVDPAWSALPMAARADRIEVIARTADGRWRTVWRLRLADERR